MALVIAIFLLYAWVVLTLDRPSLLNTSEMGQFGDAFGVLTSLFNGLAFAGLIVTITLQSRELALQRQELVFQRAQLASQADSFRQQNELSYFLELLRERRELIEGWRSSSYQSVGRQALSEDASAIRSHAARLAVGPSHNASAMGDHCRDWFRQRQASLQPLIGVHLELLEQIESLDQDDFTRPLAQRLARTYANTLTGPEIGILFYFGLTDAGTSVRNLLASRAALRDRLPDWLAWFVEVRHLSYYPASTYGKPEAV